MKFVRNAVIRGVIPLVIMSAISLILRSQGEGDDQVRSTFVTGLIIAAVAGASVIYDINDISLKKRSVIHLLVMIITVLPCLLLSGWFELNSFSDYLKVVGVFLIVGLVMWSVMFFIFTRLSPRE